MLCEKCHQKQAVVLVQTSVNGQMTQMHLCQDCVEQVESPLTFEQFFQGLLNVFGGMPGSVSAQQQKRPAVPGCPGCGLSYEDFKKTGRLGCAECYNAFRKELEPAFKNIQGGHAHEGKFPQKYGGELLNKRKASQLKLALAKAVEEEKYEEAARLRDEIRELEARR